MDKLLLLYKHSLSNSLSLCLSLSTGRDPMSKKILMRWSLSQKQLTADEPATLSFSYSFQIRGIFMRSSINIGFSQHAVLVTFLVPSCCIHTHCSPQLRLSLCATIIFVRILDILCETVVQVILSQVYTDPYITMCTLVDQNVAFWSF